MRPITLTMSAFGSYADEITIDFQNANHGLFLIAGDTGSGKTTIFDAICFALYDRTSGGQRDGSDMRSQYADPDTPTYVDFTFSYGKETYRVKRNPKYTRASKRKDKDGNEKTTTEQPSVELTMPDGHIFKGKVKETNDKLVEIMGVDADQFSQIAMIAQGEFMRLLQASSNKRKEIFSRIFQTKIYWQIQEALRTKAKKEEALLDDNRKFLELELKNIKGTQEPILFEETKTKEILETISTLITCKKEEEKQMKHAQSIRQKEWEEINSALAAGMEINKAFSQLEKVLSESKELEAQRIEQEEFKLRLEKARKALTVSYEEAKKEKEEKLLADLTKKKEQVQQELFVCVQKTKEFLAAKEEALAQKQEQEPALQESLTRNKDSLPLYDEAIETKEQVLIQEKKVQDCEKQKKKEQDALQTLQEDLIKAHEQVTNALLQYQSANDRFVLEQAGIMAEKLQDGMPCPVCGSCTHPQKAKMSDKAVTQQEVEQYKKEWMQADDKETKCNQMLTELRGKIELTNAKYHELMVQLQNLKQQQNSKEALLYYATKQEALSQIAILENTLKALQTSCIQTEKNWLESKEKESLLSGEEKAVLLQEREQINLVAEAKKQFDCILAQQGFTTYTDYEAVKMTEKDMDKLAKTIAEYHDCAVRNEEAKRQLTTQLEGKEKMDVTMLIGKQKQIEAEKKDLDKSYKEIYTLNQRNQEAKEKISALLDERKQVMKRFVLYSNLEKTANGNLVGTAKLDFQTYMQRRYFEKMIHEANKKLVRMTSNQFILQCRDIDKLGNQGAVGLDLDVYSLVTDKTRDVKTLSGGESFMAALAMALGMAEVIQNTAGKVKLDTMFVDEGFGSLDDEARKEAMNILTELAGEKRLVGIISHVTELKEQIDHKLIVEKTDRGSTARWSYGE